MDPQVEGSRADTRRRSSLVREQMKSCTGVFASDLLARDEPCVQGANVIHYVNGSRELASSSLDTRFLGQNVKDTTRAAGLVHSLDLLSPLCLLERQYNE